MSCEFCDHCRALAIDDKYAKAGRRDIRQGQRWQVRDGLLCASGVVTVAKVERPAKTSSGVGVYLREAPQTLVCAWWLLRRAPRKSQRTP